MALYAFSHSNMYLYDAGGAPLQTVAKLCDNLGQQLQDYRDDSASAMHSQLSLLVSCLTDARGDSATRIDWMALEDKSNFPEKASPSETYRAIWMYWARMQIGYFFGNLPFAERMLRKFTDISAEEKGYHTICHGLYFSGLIAAGLARQTGQRKYRAILRKVIHRINYILHSRGLVMLVSGCCT